MKYTTSHAFFAMEPDMRFDRLRIAQRMVNYFGPSERPLLERSAWDAMPSWQQFSLLTEAELEAANRSLR
jgi:hypothetical protein